MFIKDQHLALVFDGISERVCAICTLVCCCCFLANVPPALVTYPPRSECIKHVADCHCDTRPKGARLRFYIDCLSGDFVGLCYRVTAKNNLNFLKNGKFGRKLNQEIVVKNLEKL